jgi:hypothetical protein
MYGIYFMIGVFLFAVWLAVYYTWIDRDRKHEHESKE